jgi:IclR family transcriptional regulator, pca regulon regulatory protein
MDEQGGKASDRKRSSKRRAGKQHGANPGDLGLPSHPPRVRRVPDPRLSRSLEYGVAVLECFTAQCTVAGVVDLSELLGVGRSTTHRYATTLHALGYLEQDEHRKYRLARRAFEPGIAAIDAIRGLVPAGPVLARLRDRVGHTVSMGVLDRTRAIYVHRLHSHGPGQFEVDRELRVGASLPLHCTALGKALLASLPDAERRALVGELTLTRHGPGSITTKRRLSADLHAIREQGLALSDEELAVGVRSIALAVAGTNGRPLAIDVVVPASAYTMQRLIEELGPILSKAAAEISTAPRQTL